jgi:hypothetical protein
VCKYLDTEFRKILHMVATRPSNIEELVLLEEYINSVAVNLAPLQSSIEDMRAYHALLDDFQYRIDAEHFSLLWGVVAYPDKVLKRCKDAADQNVFVKRRFREEMQGQQAEFIKELDSLENAIHGLEGYHDLDDVKTIGAVVQQVNVSVLL